MTAVNRHLWIAWYGLIGTPLLTLGAQLIKFTLVSWVCGTGWSTALHLTSVIFIGLCAGGGLLCYRGWREMGALREFDGASQAHWLSNLLVMALLMSVVSTLLMVTMWLPNFFLGACD